MLGKGKEKVAGPGRVLCIGLDGATFDLIRPWIEQGRLPTLRKLIEEGAHSNLTSVIPPLSPQAWSSFMTGVNPGKHGLFGFKYQKRNAYDFEFSNNSCIKAKTLWKLMGELGKRSIIVNVPFTYPPEEINGIMVSGLGTPGTGVDFAFPHNLKKEVLGIVNDYTIHLHVWGSLDKARKRKKALNELLKMTENRAVLCRHLMGKYPWDFFMVVFTSIDQVQHHFWKYLEDEGGDGSSKFHDAILRVYEKNDEVLGSLLELVDDDTTVVIMSDHGAGKFSGIKIHIDEVLKRENLLFTGQPEKKLMSGFVFGLRLQMLRLANSLKRTLIRRLSSRTKDFVLKHLPGFRGKFAGVGLSTVDWTKTRLYPGENVDFLRVNLKGKLPQGIVEPGSSYDSLISLAINRLEDLRHPKTGERLIEKVFKGEELYHGPCLGEAPDLVIWTRDYQHVIRGDLAQDKQGDIVSGAIDDSEPSGTHRLNGIVVIKGKNIKKGHAISSAHIMDLFPTILYMMGCTIPKYCDGSVLTEIFPEACLKVNPIVYSELDMNRMAPKIDVEIYSDEENKQIERHLKELGYF